MATNYAEVLLIFYPQTKWVLIGEDYSGLEWLDESAKPTKQELDALSEDAKYQTSCNAVTVARQFAYQQTSDPIFMQYQRGEATEQEWLYAVQAVKDANPYPVQETI